MIYLSGSIPPKYEEEIPKNIGLMQTFRIKKGRKKPVPFMKTHFWAADNNCFNDPNLNVAAYLDWLEAFKPVIGTCLFVTAPDVWGDAAATNERSREILPEIRKRGFPAAFCLQDNQFNLPINWEAFDCVFVGGSDQWRSSEGCIWLVREAVKRGKWAHLGRVNSLSRILIAKSIGYHSVDGTYAAFSPDKNFPNIVRWVDYVNQESNLNNFQPLFSDL